MARQSLELVLAERPTGGIVPGKTFRLQKVPAPTEADLKPGQLLLENLYVSFDPAMRGWLDDRRSYVPPVKIGEVMRAMTISRVLASRSSKAQPGEIVTAMLGIREVGIANENQVEPGSTKLSLAGGRAKVTDLLGVLGMTGLTAFFGMTKIGEPKAGETVVVSAAAGATGSVAAQIAKIAGARVIGTAGSDEKCRWLKEELGLDVALNYKDPDFKKKFKEATPKYIDVYFDNGEIPHWVPLRGLHIHLFPRSVANQNKQLAANSSRWPWLGRILLLDSSCAEAFPSTTPRTSRARR
jgi:NADPH-dependent curcumin reductase CurA